MTITRNWIVPQIEPRTGALPPPLITTPSLPNATATVPYSFTMSATGGVPPYTWSITSQTDTSWLTITSSGVLQGTPSVAEVDSVNIKVTDSTGLPTSPTNFSLTVNPPPPPPTGYDFYIGPNAPVTNIGTTGGTQSNPWNIAAINDATSRSMYSGKRVGWLPGIYNVNAIVSAAAPNIAAPVYSIEGGTATNPTVMQSTVPLGAQIVGWLNNDGVTYPTAGAFILGQSIAQRSGQPAILHLGNVVIDGFYMAGGVGGFIIWDGGTTTPPPQPFLTGLVVQNCETYALSAVGATGQNLGHYKCQGTSGAIVQNCIMHGVYSNGFATLANSSLIFSFVSQNNLYQYNTLYDSPTLIHDKNPNVNNSLIQYNYMELNGLDAGNSIPTTCLEDCTGGINGTTTTVQNNIFVIPSTQGTANAKVWFGADFQNGFGGNNLPDSCQSSIVFANNTVVTTANVNFFIQCLGNVAGATPSQHHQYNNILVTTGANIVSTINGACGQCDGPGCQGVQDYNIWSCTNPTTFSIASTRTAAGFQETQTSTAYTVAQWQAHVPGIESHSTFATIAPSALFVQPNIGLNPNGYKLLPGSAASGTARVGGVSTGAACDAGAWGGPNPPSQIGSNLQNLNWQTLKVGSGGFVRGMTIAADGTLIGRTDTNGAYLYNTTSGTWNQLFTSSSLPASLISSTDIGVIGQGCYEVAIAPSNTQILYAAYIGYIFVSTNQGQTWTQTGFANNAGGMNPNANPYSEYGQKLAVDPSNSNIVYAGTTNNGLYVTINGGSSWSQVAAVPTGNAAGITGIVFDPTGGVSGGVTQRIYVCSNGNGVYRTTNGGSTWVLLSGSPTTVINAQVDSGSNYWAVTSAGVSRYNGSWTQVLANSGNACQAIAVNPFNISEVVSVDAAGYIQQSTNSGGSWSAKNFSDTITATDIPWLQAANNQTPPVFYLDVGGAAFSPVTNGLLYCSAGTGMWKMTVPTTVGSTVVNWTDFSVGIEQLVANELIVPPITPTAVFSAPLLASWDRPVFQITDIPANNTYPSTYFPVASNTIQAGWSIDYASSNPSYVAAIVYYNSAESCFSTNGGASWTQFSSKYASALGGCIACSTPSNLLWAPVGTVPGYSTNGGTSWTAISITGISSWSTFLNAYYLKQRAICADRVAATTFYLYYPGNGVYISSNGGATWTQQLAGYIESNHSVANFQSRFSAVPGNSGHLFYTPGYVGGTTPSSPGSIPLYRSTNAGVTWTAVPNVVGVSAFGFGAQAPTGSQTYPTIWIVGFVNNVFGVWRSLDNCATWWNLGSFPAGNLGLICTISGDPNNVDYCYVGYGGGTGTGAGYGCFLP